MPARPNASNGEVLRAVAGDFSEGQSMQQTKAYRAGRWIGEVIAVVVVGTALAPVAGAVVLVSACVIW